MSFFENMPQSTRRSALAVMMLAILLLSAAAAWIIVASRSAQRPGETWYLITIDDTPVGWRVTQRETLDTGGTTGYDIVYTSDGDASVLWSRWRLNAAQTRGSYASEGARMSGPQIRTLGTTYVDYDAPVVGIRQELGGGVRFTEPLKVGDNYIPEGRLAPTIVQVAGTGQPFTGEMVVDPLMALKPLTITPEGRQRREVGGESIHLAAVVLRWLDEDFKGFASRYFVAHDGSILVIERIDADGKATETATRATIDDVRRHFPNAHRTRSVLLRDDLFD